MKPLLFFDLELNAPSIMEWGAVYNDVEESILVKQQYVPSYIKKITGISTDMTADGIDEAELLIYINNLFEHYTVVGFAIQNSDLKIIRKRCAFFNIEYKPPEYIDLQRIEINTHTYANMPSLSAVYQKYVSDDIPKNAHRALTDAQMTKAIFEKNPEFWRAHALQQEINHHQPAQKRNKFEYGLLADIIAWHNDNLNFNYDFEQSQQQFESHHPEAIKWAYIQILHARKLTLTIEPIDNITLKIPLNYSELPKAIKSFYCDNKTIDPVIYYYSLQQQYLKNAADSPIIGECLIS